MKILKRKIIKGEGFVHLIPTEEEDLWHIYNLVQEGDKVSSFTTRKVVQTSKSGVKNSFIKKIVLTLKIVKITYHASDHLALEINGQNLTKNDFMSLNQHHTFSVVIDQPLTIIKSNWGGYHMKILKELSNPSADADVAALVMDEGIAHLCCVKTSMTLLKHKVEKVIPKKRAGSGQRDTAMQKFFKMCFDAMITTDFEKVQCFIIASPGFVKDDFYKYIKEQAQSDQYSNQFKQHGILGKLLIVGSSTGYLNALSEVLQDPSVMQKLENTKAVKQIKIFDEFYKVMSKDENQVAYSEKEVIECFKQKAISVLLISDNLFRTKDLKRRNFFNALVDNVNRQGGETYIFSSLHSSGQKLNNLSGIAAILKYPIQFEDDEDEDDDDEEQKNNDENNNKQKNDYKSLNLQEDDQGIDDADGNDDNQEGNEFGTDDFDLVGDFEEISEKSSENN